MLLLLEAACDYVYVRSKLVYVTEPVWESISILKGTDTCSAFSARNLLPEVVQGTTSKVLRPHQMLLIIAISRSQAPHLVLVVTAVASVLK